MYIYIRKYFRIEYVKENDIFICNGFLTSNGVKLMQILNFDTNDSYV